MSKGYNMAGWRVGFCAGNAEMIRALSTIKAYYDYGMFRPIQIAAIMALRHGDADVEAQSAEYQRRRDVLVDGLRRIGWEVNPPRASMFLWVKIPGPVVRQAQFAGIRHEAVGRGERGRQPRQRFRPGRRRLFANGADRKRKPAAASGAADRALPGAQGQGTRGEGRGTKADAARSCRRSFVRYGCRIGSPFAMRVMPAHGASLNAAGTAARLRLRAFLAPRL